MSEYGLLRKMSYAGRSFVWEMFWKFCRYLNIHQAISWSYKHQTNGWAEAHITFIKHTKRKYFETNNDVYLAVLQMTSTFIGPGLPSAAALVFNRPIRGLILKLSTLPILFDHSDDHRKLTEYWYQQWYKSSLSPLFLPTGSTVTVQMEDRSPWTLAEHYNGRSYKIHVIKLRYIIMRMQRHVKHIPILAEEYLWDELKMNTSQVSKTFNELINTYIMLYNSKEQA